MWLLVAVVPELVLTLFRTPLLIVEFVLLIGCSLHVNRGVVYVLI